jgi:hypothetical protein
VKPDEREKGAAKDCSIAPCAPFMLEEGSENSLTDDLFPPNLFATQIK